LPRQAPQIRDAVPEDAADLLALWAATSRNGVISLRAEDDARSSLATMAADPDQRFLVAEAEGQIVAAMKLSRGPLSPLTLEPAVHSSFLLVHPQFRRHGYAHALMDVALVWADEKSITQVTAITDTNRETNRFFARLGLTTLGTVRHASVLSLRKKLATERGHAGARNRQHLVEVLAQRRSMRRRQETA
jgi:N-acetylglutamate synthase-like GNAT family acetyltransferase